MSIQGSAMMYVTAATLPSRLLGRRDQPSHHLAGALEERGLDDHLVEPGGVGAPEPLGVRVVRVAEDRDIRVVVRNVVRVDPRNVGDHEIGRIDRVRRREPMLGKHRLELAADVEVDPTQQDRRHACNRP
jgi:hypothetical protein